MILDGVGGSEAWDSSGEKLEVEGADIDDVAAGTCLLNWEHGDPDEQGPSAIVGKVILAKKIFKRDDCENDRQRHYWDQTKLPFIYIVCRLFDDAGHRQAQNLAAIIRDAVKHGELQVCRFSVEGHTLRREGQVLKETLVRRWAITVKPANKSSLAGIVEDKEAPEGFEVHPEKTEEDELAKILAAAAEDQKVKKYEKLSTGWGSLNKALTASVGAGAAPSQLTGHQAVMVEDRTLRRRKIEDLVRKAVELPDGSDARAFAKANMSDVSDEFLAHFERATDALRIKLGRGKLAKADDVGARARAAGDPLALETGQHVKIFNFTEPVVGEDRPHVPGTIVELHTEHPQMFASPTGVTGTPTLHEDRMRTPGATEESQSDLSVFMQTLSGKPIAVAAHLTSPVCRHPPGTIVGATVRDEATGHHRYFAHVNNTRGHNWYEVVRSVAPGPNGTGASVGGAQLIHQAPAVADEATGDADPTRKAELEKAMRNDNVRAALMVLLANRGRYRLTERALRHCVYAATGRSQQAAESMGAGWNVGAARQRAAGLWALQPDGTVDITDLGISRLYEKYGQPSAEDLTNFDAGALHPAAARYAAADPPKAPPQHRGEWHPDDAARRALDALGAPPDKPVEDDDIHKSESNWESLVVELSRLAILMKAHDGSTVPKIDAPPADACPECTGGVAAGGGICYACGGRGHRVRGLDADLHGVDHLNDTDEQRALVHGLVTASVERPPHAEIGNGSVHHWAVHPGTGCHVILKRSSDYAEDHEVDVARHEVAYHNLARDVFGLGHHVPVTAAFIDPGTIDKELHPSDYDRALNDPYDATGKMHSVQEAIPDAEHVARINGWDRPDLTGDQQKVLGNLLRDGSLDKLALMNAVLGNSDRHAGNFMFSPHEPRLHLIDNGYAFLRFTNTPNYLTGASTSGDHMLDEAPHKTALDWLIGLSGGDLEHHALKYGITAPRAWAARKRLEDMQRRAIEGHDVGVTRRDLFREARAADPAEYGNDLSSTVRMAR